MILKFPVKDEYTKLNVLIPVTITKEGDALALEYPFCRPLMESFKAMAGARWHGYDKKNPRKIWTIDDCPRNWFQMDAMRWLGRDAKGVPILGEKNPYARYDAPMVDVSAYCGPRLYQGKLTTYYGHQPEGIAFVMTRRQCILAWDMGCGKSLIAGTAMETAKILYKWSDEDFWFVCKNGALYQVMLDFLEWDIKVRPKFMSYDQMKGLIETWPRGKKPPKFVVFDESTQIKSPTAQRSDAAQHLADNMRAEYGNDAFVVLMTGTPSPKNPTDWWKQSEIACPGFVKEGSWQSFRKRLAVIAKQTKGEDGGSYNKVMAWLDDEKRCKHCGEFEPHSNHSVQGRLQDRGHVWEKSVNEVLRIDSRLRGFVSKKLKKDCMDLPEQVYRIVRCRPTFQMLNAAKLIAKAARGAADALTKLRELSDGFQYQDTVSEVIQCPMCAGTGTMLAKEDPENPGLPISEEAMRIGRLVDVTRQCDRCQGRCEVEIKERIAARVPCPKDDIIEDLLAEHDDVGRLPIYCGFTGSVDRVVDICLRNKWSVIRVDARGWTAFDAPGQNLLPGEGKAMYHTFRFGGVEKIAFVAQASSAAHGLNFDNCPTIVNFSRDFNFENAMQGDERNMRGKIKETLAKTGRTKVTVVEIVHLESDQYVLDNHKKKRRLQSLTLGEIQAAVAVEPRQV